MKKIIFVSLLANLLVMYVTAQTSPKELNKNQKATDALTKELETFQEKDVINGFSVALVNQEGTLYQHGFGYADVETKVKYTENTLQNIASISKTVLAVALLKAKEMGVLELDDPINKYLPYKLINPHFPDTPITIRHLATHTSTIVDGKFYMEKSYILKEKLSNEQGKNTNIPQYFNPPENWLSMSDFMARRLHRKGEWFDNTAFAERKPGELYEYSNIGAALCALVVEFATGKAYNQFTREMIFEPLKMTSTGWFYDEVDFSKFTKLYKDKTVIPHYICVTYPDGHLITSSNNLAKFLAELMRGFAGKGTLLKAESYAEIFRSQLEPKNFAEKDEYNVGLFIEKHLKYNAIGHSGGDPGVNTLMFFDPDKMVGRILLENTDSDRDEMDKVFWGVWDTLKEYRERLK